ncbi:MAG: hypothetical protein H7A23_06725 [Leptospiraceae bacterium]|nr:hypothetical protein [Nanoarchaeota archaeon]MCP5494234.1 hypothetical protein [Leptospiraceae bacterium]
MKNTITEIKFNNDFRTNVESFPDMYTNGNVIIHNRPIFQTESDIDNRILPFDIQNEFVKENIIVSIDGTVLGWASNLEDFVRISINNQIIQFPKELFTDISLIKFGQPISYVIKEKVNGIRYQTIEKREVKKNIDSECEELLTLLDNI